MQFLLTIGRIGLIGLAAIAALVGGKLLALMLGLGGAAAVASVAAAVAGGVAAWWLTGLGGPVVAGALGGAGLLGLIGFAGGFFGPMLFTPEANQGPMLGLFITGPGGGLLGAVLGALWGARR